MTAANAPQADLVGAILSKKYPLKRMIGAGSMGAVYESQSPDDGKPLAIKVLAIDYLTDTDIKNRFIEEGHTCQRLIHPNIVRVFDVGTAEDGTPYIVMELLEGTDLSRLLNTKGPLPLAELTIAERLKPAGYTSCQIGKWHLEAPPERKTKGKSDEAEGGGGASHPGGRGHRAFALALRAVRADPAARHALWHDPGGARDRRIERYGGGSGPAFAQRHRLQVREL